MLLLEIIGDQKMSNESIDNSLIFPHIHQLLVHLEKERKYLYALLINLMVEVGKNEVTFTGTDLEFSEDFNVEIKMSPETEELNIKIIRAKEQKL